MVTRWSARRRTVSAAVLVPVLALAGVVAWRASLSPLTLWGGGQCASLPKGDVAHVYGLAMSDELRGAGSIRILGIETDQRIGSAPPSVWVVPAPHGHPGVGILDLADPPAVWRDRRPAVGAELAASRPEELVVDLAPLHGRALLTGVRIDYRTPDGFPHVALGDPVMEIDTTGRCSASTGG